MFNKTDEISSAAPEGAQVIETSESRADEEATENTLSSLLKPGESHPLGFEKPGSGFLWYINHPPTAEEVIQRMKDLPNRREKIIAAIRKSQDRNISS